MHFRLAEGVLHFLEPVAGQTPGAEFHGKGRLRIEPPNALEAQQLRLLAKQDVLDLEFSDAVFIFSDGTFEEVSKGAHWLPGGSGPAAFYAERLRVGEDVGRELLPRIFKSLLSPDKERNKLFFADVKTADRGWIQARYDALDAEEIQAGHWVEWVRLTHFETWLSFPAGGRSSADSFSDPVARQDATIRAYRVEAGVNDEQELRATTQVSLEYRVPGERVLVFELDSNLRVSGVKSAGGIDLAYF